MASGGHHPYATAPRGPGEGPTDGEGGAAGHPWIVQAMGPAFWCGAVAGIPIYMSVLHPVFLGLNVVLAAAAVDLGTAAGQASLWFAVLAWGPGLFVTVLAHELGHCTMCLRLSGHVDRILLWPFGGLAYIGHPNDPENWARNDLAISLAGPATHVPLVVVCVLLLLAVPPHAVLWDYAPSTLGYGEDDAAALTFWLFFNWLVKFQVVLFVFNLCVPMYPLDGGRVLCDTMMLAGYSVEQSARVTLIVTVPLAVGALLWGFFTASYLLMAMAVYIMLGGYRMYQMLEGGVIHEHPQFQAVAKARDLDAQRQARAYPAAGQVCATALAFALSLAFTHLPASLSTLGAATARGAA